MTTLNELHGVKKHAAQDLTTKNDVLGYLQRKGFKILGSGAFGIVCDHPSFNGRYVLKVFSDKAYEAFIDFCIANNGNPHLPKIYGRKINLKPNACMVRIEVLQDMSAGDWHQRFIPTICAKAAQVARGELSYKVGVDMAAFTQQEELFKTLVAIVKAKPADAALDLTQHHGNCMLRGQTVVVTDPYASRSAPFGFKRPRNPNADRLAKLRGF